MEMNLIWETAFFAAAFVFVVGIASLLVKKRRAKHMSLLGSFPMMALVVFLSLFVLHIPMYIANFGMGLPHVGSAILLSIRTSIGIFVLEGDYGVYASALQAQDFLLEEPSLIFMSALYLLAPICLAGFVLSFMRETTAYMRYLIGFNREAYIFSELSEKSLILAKSIKKHFGENPEKKVKPLIVFTEVSSSKDSSSHEFYSDALEEGFICFKNNLHSIRFDLHAQAKRINFIIAGDDQGENKSLALHLLDSNLYVRRDPNQTWLYIVDSSKAGRLLFDGRPKGMVIRRITPIRQFTNYFLWEDLWDAKTCKHELFENALYRDGKKVISVIILGLGEVGSTLLKTLIWFAQMDGYFLEIHAFDRDAKTISSIYPTCPELLDDKHNHRQDPRDAQYSVNLYPDIDVREQAFVDAIAALAASTTMVYIALGDDDLNIETALDMHVLLLRNVLDKRKIPIYAVVNDIQRTNMFNNIDGESENADDSYAKNCIEVVGDNSKVFAYDTIFNPRLEEAAEKAHLAYSNYVTEEERREQSEVFWSQEYSRNSNIASVMHTRLVQVYGPKSKAENQALPKEAIELLEDELEHIRWSAYIRSEGWISGPKKNINSREHNDLVSFDDLSSYEKKKDRVVKSGDSNVAGLGAPEGTPNGQSNAGSANL